MIHKHPKLRSVVRSIPPFPLNEFPQNFPQALGKELIYLLATKGTPSLEGSDWEAIFAKCIGAQWKPSNVGLDDVVLGNTAWGAKSVKATKPSTLKKIRLISGRNSPIYSYGSTINTSVDPNKLGEEVLGIWNERVTSIRQKYSNLRTVVLIKSDDLTEVVVYEYDTIRYDPELFYWQWNERGNLEGYDKDSDDHRFTWQPHGAQFTIIDDVPDDRMIIQIKKPPLIDEESVLAAIGYDDSWIKVSKPKD